MITYNYRPKYGDAVISLTNGGASGPTDGPISEWQFDKDKTPPTEKAIQAKLTELQADYDSKEYQRKRLAEYPDLQECIHAILDDDLTALQAKRKLIKDKFPKPE
jgi:hypothetical protein